MENKVDEILNGSIIKMILFIAIPVFLGSLLQQFYSIFDSYIIGNYAGKEALASIDSTVIISNFLILFFVGIGGGASVLISHHYGAKQFNKMSTTINTSITFSIVSGLTITIIGIIITPLALRLINVPESLMENATLYLRLYLLSTTFSILYNVGSGISRSIGDAKTPVYYLGVATIINVVADYILVVILNMSVMGAAIATSFAVIVSGSLMTRYLLKAEFREKKSKIFDAKEFKKILKLGIPMGVESSLFSISNLLLRSSLNQLGTDVIVAWGIYGKINAIPYLLLNAISIGLTTFIGQNYGAKRMDRVKKSVSQSLLLTAPLIILICLIIYLNINCLAGFFLNDTTGVVEPIRIICTCFSFYVIFVPVRILSGAIKGTGNSVVPMLITLAGTCVLRIIYIVLYIPSHLDIFSISIIYPITWGITSIIFITYYLYYKKKVLNNIN